MDYLLAIDQGTSSTRARVYNLKGDLIYTSQIALTQYYPSPGWVEQDPEEMWANVQKALSDIATVVDPKKIIACGITNQRETTMIWDKQTGKCLSPAIVWQDRRTQDDCLGLIREEKLIQERTGLLLDPYFSATKLQWLLRHVPTAKDMAKKGRLAFGTVDTFLIWRLTGGKSHLTDITNASRTMLFNLLTCEWDDELLSLFDIPRSVLPQVLDCDAYYGTIQPTILSGNIPITGVAGDQQAALAGQHCFDPSSMKATFGTGGFLLLNTGDSPIFSTHKLITTIAYRIQKKIAYGLEGSILQAGTTVKWLRDELKVISSASETETLAQSLQSNEGVYFVPSFTGLGAPHWISASGAIMVGISRLTNRAHFARAALEGVAYQARELLECMKADSKMNFSTLAVDGGMSTNNWFLQFLADQCQLIVQRPHDIETTALGAALLAGIGCKALQSLETGFNTTYEKQFLPNSNQTLVQENFSGWQRALKMLMV